MFSLDSFFTKKKQLVKFLCTKIWFRSAHACYRCVSVVQTGASSILCSVIKTILCVVRYLMSSKVPSASCGQNETNFMVVGRKVKETTFLVQEKCV